MPIYYDVEIPGGLPAAGTVYAEDGYIDGFDLPDGTRVEVMRDGRISCKGYWTRIIATLVYDQIRGCHSIAHDVAMTRPESRPDSPPIRIDWRVG